MSEQPYGQHYPPMHRPPPAIPPPAGGPVRLPTRVEAVPGTPFGVAFLPVPRTVSGTAVGALVAGIGSLIVLLLVGCFGWLGAQNGVGALVGGAFAVLGTLLGAAGISLGVSARRQIRRSGVGGRGMAVAGISCGAAGIALIVLVMLVLLVT